MATGSAFGADSTGNANNGLAGGAATTAGQIGAAGSYNGTAASYLLLPQVLRKATPQGTLSYTYL